MPIRITLAVLLIVAACANANQTEPVEIIVSTEIQQTDRSDVTIETKTVNSPASVAPQGSKETENVLPTERTFKDEEKTMIEYVNSLLRKLLPHIMNSAERSFSQRCMSTMMKVFAGMKRLNGWTLKLLDSSSKLDSGILNGRSQSMGDYDQCLAVSVTTKGMDANTPEEEWFSGKYCEILIQQPTPIVDRAVAYNMGEVNRSSLGKLKEMIETSPFLPIAKDYMSHYLGICVPSLCNEEDVASIMHSFPFPGQLSVTKCETRVPFKLDFEQRFLVGVFYTLVILVLLGTLGEIISRFCSRESNHCEKKKCLGTILAFSVASNTKKLLHRIREDTFEVPDWRTARGLVVLAIACIVVNNTYLLPYKMYYRQTSELSHLESYLEQWNFSFVVSSPIFIEILFLYFGFSITSKVWKDSTDKVDVKVNVFSIAFWHYLRLLVPLLVCVAFVVVLGALGSGPFWNDFYGSLLPNCKWNWGRIFGMYGNFVDVEKQCFLHFWFVPCLMQVILFSLILILVLARWPKFGSLMTIFVVVGCDMAVGLATYRNELPPAFVAYFANWQSNLQWRIQESWPFAHFPSYAIGMLLGIAMTKKSKKQMKSCTAFIAWIISIGLLVICFLGPFYFKERGFTPTPLSAAFAGLQKTLFSVAIAWVIWACGNGYGGLVHSILSWRVLDPLFRLSYFAYLLNQILVVYLASTAREHFTYQHTELVLRSVSSFFLTYSIAYICYMLTIMPLRSLRQVLCSSKTQEVVIMKNGTNNELKSSQKNCDVMNYFKHV